MMHSSNLGIIKGCDLRSAECNHKCCAFTDNYILLYPGEYENSRLDKEHLVIIDNDHFGGKKAVCTRGSCDQDVHLKPVECRSYPLFPRVGHDKDITVLKASRCPLTVPELEEHTRAFLETWKRLLEDDRLLEWLEKASLSGRYEPV